MSTLTCEVSENAPPCLFDQNSNRVVSLLDVVELFNAWGLYQVLRRLEILADRLETVGALPLSDEQGRDVFTSLEFAREQLLSARLPDLEYKAQRNALSISQAGANTSSVAAILRELYLDIDNHVRHRRFVLVRPDRSQYAGQEQPLGKEVYDAFEKARYDIREAANCFAVDANTATIFHLMRVAEHGVRALAYDRRVKVPKGPIDLATWEDIIKELENAERAIQGYPKMHAREAQYKFYHGAMMEVRSFKNVWRNPYMHTRGFLNEDDERHEAERVVRRVGDFMKILASRIAEGKRTPRIWKHP